MEKFEFEKTIAKLKEVKYNLPIRLANTAQRYFSLSFHNGGFDGKKWKEVKRRISGTKEFKYPKTKDLQRRKRAILVGKTRDLQDSIRHSIRIVTWEKIVLGTDVSYAEYHNEGTANIPQRQFMGDAHELRNLLDKEIGSALKNVFGK